MSLFWRDFTQVITLQSRMWILEPPLLAWTHHSVFVSSGLRRGCALLLPERRGRPIHKHFQWNLRQSFPISSKFQTRQPCAFSRCSTSSRGAGEGGAWRGTCRVGGDRGSSTAHWATAALHTRRSSCCPTPCQQAKALPRPHPRWTPWRREPNPDTNTFTTSWRMYPLYIAACKGPAHLLHLTWNTFSSH